MFLFRIEVCSGEHIVSLSADRNLLADTPHTQCITWSLLWILDTSVETLTHVVLARITIHICRIRMARHWCS